MDLSIFGIESTSTALVAVLTGVALVVLGLTTAALIGPRSYAPQKGEPYECGIPTRGDSMVQFKVGYYLFAILFLMFDVERVFLFPCAVIAKGMGVESLLAAGVFLFVLILGLAYAWRKGALQWK